MGGSIAVSRGFVSGPAGFSRLPPVGGRPLSGSRNSYQFLVLPLLDGFFVALQGSPVGLLVTPPQRVQDSSHMVRMVDNLELLLNQLGNQARSPDPGSPAKGARTLQKKLKKLLLLLLAQSRWAAWRRTHFQAFLAQGPTSVPPSHDGAGVTANAPGYLVQRHILLKQSQCLATTLFKYLRRTF
jgi:hypothetical protein